MQDATNFQPVLIGTSPAGVEWVARKPEQVEIMRERLAALHAKANRSRRVEITGNQADLLEDMFSCRDDGSDKAFNLRRSFIEGGDQDLKGLADEVEDRAGDAADFALSNIFKDISIAQEEFIQIAAFAGVLNLAAKLRGEKLSAKAARAQAKEALKL